MKLKKLILFLFIAAVGIYLAACDKKKPDHDPVIYGAEDIEIEKGTTFIPLQGITAFDEEDGDLTDKITYSGNVNVQVVGEYEAVYTVTDSDGNTVQVKRKVKVVLTDNTPPFMTGVDDIEIIVGDPAFTLLGGVEANDTIDGNLTSKITTTGTVNIWVPGDYNVKYTVTDNSGNKKEVTRKITVGFGDFIFLENALEEEEIEFTDGVYEATVSGGATDGVLADFALAKLTFTASAAAATKLAFTLTNATSIGEIDIAAGEKEYTVYFRVSEEIVDGTLKFEVEADIAITNLEFSFGEARDVEPPVINAPETKVVVPAFVDDPAVLKQFILTGVSATDNIDQIITSRLDVDFGDIELGVFKGEAEVTIFVLDSSNNRTEVKRLVEFAEARSTNFIKDPTFTDPDLSQWGLNGGAGKPEILVEDGVFIHRLTENANPGWDSASSPRLESTTDLFRAGNWYLLKFDVKVATARKMTIRIGLDTTEAAGWIENFEGASNFPINPTTEWKTAYVIFYVHAECSQAANSNVVKIEFKVGSYDWGENERVNTLYMDNLQFYLLSNDNYPPELTLNDELPTTFGKGDPLPDFTEYIIAYDFEDSAEIEILPAYIDASAVNMNAAGEYDVLFSVPDSDGAVATYTLKIKVLETKDTTPPVLAEKDDLEKEIDQFTEIDLLTAITATDDVDGEIVIKAKMISGEVNVNVAGTYEVTYTVWDSSGNVSTLTLTFVVKDKEAPKFSGKNEITATEGDILNPFAIVSCEDNVDSKITLTLEHISGYEGFLGPDGKLLKTGTFTLTYTVTDTAGNTGTFTVTVTVNPKGETELVEEKVVYDILASQPPIDAGSASYATVEYDEETGEAHIVVSDVGSWASYAKMKIWLSDLEEGKTYKIKITVKADEARQLKFTLGQSLNADPWYNKFTILEGSSDTITISDEYQTYTVLFVYDKPFEANGPAMEFCFGKVGHAGDKAGNDIYISKFEIIKMKEVPVEDVAVDILASQPPIDAGSASYATVEYDEETGEAHIVVSDVGSWASYAKMKIWLSDLEEGKTYKIKITVKADEARQLKFTLGQSLNADPWYNKFTIIEGSDTITISNIYETYYITFVYDKPFEANGPAMEFCFGKVGHAGDIAGNDIYISEFKILNVPEEEPEEQEELLKDILAEKPPIDAGSASVASVEYNEETGEATISVSDVGGWASYAKMKFWLTGIEYGQIYRIKITVKADEARQLKFTIGQSLNAEPWYDLFTILEGSAVITISEEYETYVITFVYDVEYKQNGPAMEFCFGNVGHAGDKAGNDIYISGFEFYKVTKAEEGPEEPEEPEQPELGELVTDILAGQPPIDSGSKDYATVEYDEETGEATISVFNVGTYASFAKVKIKLEDLVFGETYIFLITVKADEARQLRFTVGQALWDDPWFNKFTILGGEGITPDDTGSVIITIGAEYATYAFAFTYDQAFKDGGPMLEFGFGKVGHAGDKPGNDIYISEMAVYAVKAEEEKFIADILASKPLIDSGSASVASVEYDEATGEGKISVTDVGDYPSYAKMKIALGGLVADKTYQLVITVKADEARMLRFTVGQALWGDPWFNKFTVPEGEGYALDNGSVVIEIGEEYATYSFEFTYDQPYKDGGPTLEFNFGKIGHAGDKPGNDIYISEFKIVEINA